MNESTKTTAHKKTFSFWRKIHQYGFGYYKWLAFFISAFLTLCALTGILYNHHHDFELLEKGRISTSLLPDSYQERLDRTRQAQGLQNLFPEEGNSVPVMWVIQDLHTGQIFGFWGRIFYDLLGVVMVLLAISGCYLHLVNKSRADRQRKD